MGYTRILVPLDGSDVAAGALKHIDRIAGPESKILLLSVIPEMVAEEVFTAPYLWPNPEQELEARKTYLEHVAESLKAQGYDVRYEVQAGPIVGTIARATELGCDIVLMATHRRTGVGRFILGSVSQDIVQKAHCPVLIV